MTTSNDSTILNELSEQRHKVDFDTYDLSIQQLVYMVESGQIDVAPVYQRRFRWDDARQAQLVESLFLGVPVPSLYMATNANGTWEVVDGVQRLSTIVHFAGTRDAQQRLAIPGELKLSELTKLKSMNDLTYAKLPVPARLAFSMRVVKVIALNDKSDLDVRYDLFERLNTGGVRLSAQEIRDCLYRGEFAEFLSDLASNSQFQKLVHLTDTGEVDGTREECVLRFFSFYEEYQQFDHSVVEFLNSYMRRASLGFNYRRSRALFEQTVAELVQILPHGIRRGHRNLTPINLFEAVMVGAALALNQNGKFKPARDATEWINGDELKQLTTGATNNKSRVKGRIEFVARQLGWKESKSTKKDRLLKKIAG